jgi:hypothetical protein
MDTIMESNHLSPIIGFHPDVKDNNNSSASSFIEANTEQIRLEELRDEHIIPVFSATNEPLISHHEFIETVGNEVQNWFANEKVLRPSIRVSHPVKGRIPEARYKRASELEPWESTLYYERMMFCIEIPSIFESVNGNHLSLVIGGVKAFSKDNLYGKRPSGEQNFQLFIGFKNKVCTNLCISTDGIKLTQAVRSIHDLKITTLRLLHQYDMKRHLQFMDSLGKISINESEVAQLIGKARLLRHLPEELSKDKFQLQFGDNQIGIVARELYTDASFKMTGKDIDLWKMYNLFTGANKSTYIDQFVDRAVNAQNFMQEVIAHKKGEKQSWFLG